MMLSDKFDQTRIALLEARDIVDELDKTEFGMLETSFDRLAVLLDGALKTLSEGRLATPKESEGG